MRNPVIASVVWVFGILIGILAYIYTFQWEEFKKLIISETVHTLSSPEYLTQLGNDILRINK